MSLKCHKDLLSEKVSQECTSASLGSSNTRAPNSSVEDWRGIVSYASDRFSPRIHSVDSAVVEDVVEGG
jgi:hypothetical protein